MFSHSEPLRITDLLNQKLTFSYEVTPDLKPELLDDVTVEPLFYSVTWHARMHGCSSLDIAPLNLAKILRKKGKQVLLHIACDHLKKGYLDNMLQMLQENGICNLFTLLGEAYDERESDFKCTSELIQYIRENWGTYFCIVVAGFPTDPDEKLIKLKDKLKSGANLIITQAIFEVEKFKSFMDQCKKQDIKVPIIAGILFFDNYDDLVCFTECDKIVLPQDTLTRVKNNPGPESKAVLKKVIKDIQSLDLNILDIHIFSMNKLKSVSALIKEITES